MSSTTLVPRSPQLQEVNRLNHLYRIRFRRDSQSSWQSVLLPGFLTMRRIRDEHSAVWIKHESQLYEIADWDLDTQVWMMVERWGGESNMNIVVGGVKGRRRREGGGVRGWGGGC